MKRLPLLLIVVSMLISTSVFAQDPAPAAPGAQTQTFKGFAEVDLGLGMCMGDCDNVDPSFGLGVAGFYMVIPNVAVGGQFHYQNYGVDGASLYTWSAGAEGRYYYQVAPKIKVFGLGGFGIVKATSEVTVMGETHTGTDSGYHLQLGGGAAYFIMPNMSVGASLKYQINMWDDNNGTFNKFFFGGAFSYYF